MPRARPWPKPDRCSLITTTPMNCALPRTHGARIHLRHNQPSPPSRRDRHLLGPGRRRRPGPLVSKAQGTAASASFERLRLRGDGSPSSPRLAGEISTGLISSPPPRLPAASGSSSSRMSARPIPLRAWQSVFVAFKRSLPPPPPQESEKKKKKKREREREASSARAQEEEEASRARRRRRRRRGGGGNQTQREQMGCPQSKVCYWTD